jgi:hypothetical protein
MFIAVTAQYAYWKNFARSFVKEYGASSVLCKRNRHRILKKFYTTISLLLGSGVVEI